MTWRVVGGVVAAQSFNLTRLGTRAPTPTVARDTTAAGRRALEWRKTFISDCFRSQTKRGNEKNASADLHDPVEHANARRKLFSQRADDVELARLERRELFVDAEVAVRDLSRDEREMAR